MKCEERKRLLRAAKNYAEDELQLFIEDTDWQDWMNEYTEAEDGEQISEQECKKIDEILTKIFNEAHA